MDVYCFGNTLIGLKTYCILNKVSIKFCNNLCADLQSRKRVCNRVANYKEELVAKVFLDLCGF